MYCLKSIRYARAQFVNVRVAGWRIDKRAHLCPRHGSSVPLGVASLKESAGVKTSERHLLYCAGANGAFGLSWLSRSVSRGCV
jgi:hypothetical protein